MNKVILMGRLTKDVDLKYTSGNNTAVASFTLAVNRSRAKEGQPQTDFINCQAWSKTAEFISKYFTKGQQVAVIGRIQNRSWDDNEGKKHYATEIIVDEAFFADSKKDSQQQSAPQRSEANDAGFYPVPEPDDDVLPF
jgi:single-strand DNA-binding protein